MESTPRRRIAVTGGGTAGHILPALEFLEAYRREFGAEGFFIGCKVGMERHLVPARSVRLETIPGRPWARQGWFGRMRALASIPSGILAARKILRREKVDLVIGTGGYASVGACLAAKTLGVPVAIHESNIEPGLANRLISKFAGLIGVGFEETRRAFGARSIVTGIPAQRVRRKPPAIPNFVVLGGSEGSPVLNREAPRFFGEMHRRGVRFTVRHLTGFSDPAKVERAYEREGVEACVKGFVDDMRTVYENATFAFAAAGALTLAELSACGIPCLLAPTPGSADNHQVSNARFYVERAGTFTIPAGPWDTDALAFQIETLLENSGEMAELQSDQHDNSKVAATELVRECEKLLTRLVSGTTQGSSPR